MLNNIDNVKLPIKPLNNETHSYHLYALSIDFNLINKSRTYIINALKSKGIGTQVHYIPLFYQPYYSDIDLKYPGAVKYYNSTLSIPMYVGLNQKDIKYITDSFINIIHA